MLSQSISMGVIELKRKHDAAAVNSSLVRRPIRRWAPLFMGPMLCAFAIGFVYPFCKGVYLSFCKFKTTSDAQFIGFGNYIKALNETGYKGFFTIERECGADPTADIKLAVAFLKKLLGQA